MAFTLKLLRITLCEWEKSGHMEHDLFAHVLCINTVLPCLAKLVVQTTSVPIMCGQGYPLSYHVKELVHGRAVGPVAKHGLLTGLTHILVNNTELETIHKNMPENIAR